MSKIDLGEVPKDGHKKQLANTGRLVCLYSPVYQSGKSTVANIFCENGFVRVKLATPIKQMIRALLNSVGIKNTEDYIEGKLKRKPIHQLGGATCIYLMQTIGNEWGRVIISPDLWITRASRQIEQHTNVVIDDMRYANEFDYFKRIGGLMIKVIRPDRQIDISHPSECGLENKQFDLTIYNDGTLDDLALKTVRLMTQMGYNE